MLETYQGWRIISKAKAQKIAGEKTLPRMGYEIEVDGYWLANISGYYIYKRYSDPVYDSFARRKERKP